MSSADAVSSTRTLDDIRDEFVRRRGYWADDWELILQLSPETMAAYTDLSAYPWEHGSLDPKTREFIYIATTASVTHIHPIGISTHGRNALAAGATPAELVAVLALVSGIGIAASVLTTRLVAELGPETAGPPCPPERAERLRGRFTEVFGIWDERMEPVLQADPGFFDVYVEWAAVPRLSGVLTPRQVALISIAANATVTHLDEATLRREIRAALAAGVPAADVLATCQLISGVSVHSLTVGVPLIAELLDRPAH